MCSGGGARARARRGRRGTRLDARDAERAQAADVNLLELLVKVERAVQDLLVLLVKVAGVVDQDVDGAVFGDDFLGKLVQRRRVRHVDACTDMSSAPHFARAGGRPSGSERDFSRAVSPESRSVGALCVKFARAPGRQRPVAGNKSKRTRGQRRCRASRCPRARRRTYGTRRSPPHRSQTRAS